MPTDGWYMGRHECVICGILSGGLGRGVMHGHVVLWGEAVPVTVKIFSCVFLSCAWLEWEA